MQGFFLSPSGLGKLSRNRDTRNIKPRSDCVMSINLIHLYRDLVMIRNLQSSLIYFILKVKYIIVCGALKVIFICWMEEK